MVKEVGPLKFALSSVFVAGATFLLNFCLLQTLDKQDYGLWSYNVGLAIFLFALAFEWIRVGALRLGVRNTRWDGYYLSLYLSMYCFTILGVGIAAAFNDGLGVLAIYLTFHSMHEFIVTKYRIYDRKDLYVSMQGIKGVAFLIVTAYMAASHFYDFEIDYLDISTLILLAYLCLFFILYAVKINDAAVKFRVRFSYVRMEKFTAYASLFFVNSSVALAFFYIDRLMLKSVGLNELISENSAVMELVKQFIMFPMNIVSVYLFNREVSLAEESSRYLVFLMKKAVFLMCILFGIFAFFMLFNLYVSDIYFPEEYVAYWNEKWLIALLSVSLYSVKIYFFDQFFITVNLSLIHI